MHNLDFMEMIWPSRGHYCVAKPFGKGFQHKVFDKIDDAVAHAHSRGNIEDQYFAVLTLRERFLIDEKKKARAVAEGWRDQSGKVVRVHRNMAFARTLFLDIDVKPDREDAYPSQVAVFEAVNAFVKSCGLPRPWLVSSGYGLHAYWPFEEDVPADRWYMTALKLKQLCSHHGFKADPSRTSDMSSVLRVPGTSNLKVSNDPKKVLVVQAGDPPAAFDEIEARLSRTAQLLPRNERVETPTPDSLKDQAPIKVGRVAKACAQIDFLIRNPNEQTEPGWYKMLGVTRFCLDGRKASHIVSKGYDGYDPEETDKKLDQLEGGAFGPTTCGAFAETCGAQRCDQCWYKKQTPAWEKSSPLVAARRLPLDQHPISADADLQNLCELAFRRLAAMSPVDYDRCRKGEAEALGLRVGTLDEEVAKRRPSLADVRDGQGQAVNFPTIEPWDTRVEGVELLDEIEAAYRLYVVMPDAGVAAASLWSVFTHCFEEFEHSPRLGLQSPQPRCGKTSVLKVTEKLSRRALRADNVTPAALFRMIERYSPTVLVDEADAFAKENEELRGIINSGHERGGAVIRTVGDDHEPRAFATWGPMLIAGIGSLAETIEDRSIIIKLKRKTRDEKVQRLRSAGCENLHMLRRKTARFVQDYRESIKGADPEIPDELGDRGADNWRPLFAIADTAGGRWPKRARAAAIVLSSEGGIRGRSAQMMLLEDIREIFDGRKEEEIASTDLATALCGLPDRPWRNWSRGNAITPKRIADFLADFSIHPRKLKTGTRPNGYERPQFVDAFNRYLMPRPQIPI